MNNYLRQGDYLFDPIEQSGTLPFCSTRIQTVEVRRAMLKAALAGEKPQPLFFTLNGDNELRSEVDRGIQSHLLAGRWAWARALQYPNATGDTTAQGIRKAFWQARSESSTEALCLLVPLVVGVAGPREQAAIVEMFKATQSRRTTLGAILACSVLRFLVHEGAIRYIFKCIRGKDSSVKAVVVREIARPGARFVDGVLRNRTLRGELTDTLVGSAELIFCLQPLYLATMRKKYVAMLETLARNGSTTAIDLLGWLGNTSQRRWVARVQLHSGDVSDAVTAASRNIESTRKVRLRLVRLAPTFASPALRQSIASLVDRWLLRENSRLVTDWLSKETEFEVIAALCLQLRRLRREKRSDDR